MNKLKRIVGLLLCVFLVFAASACNNGASDDVEESLAAVRARDEALSVISYFTGLGSIADLEVTELDFSGNLTLSATNIFVARVGAYFGRVGEANSFLTKLKAEFASFYPDETAVMTASTSVLCNIALLLDELGQDASDFLGYDLFRLAAFNNASLALYEDIYSMPLMLEVMSKTDVPENADYSASDIMLKIFAQSINGGYAYSGAEDADVDTTALVLLGLSSFNGKTSIEGFDERCSEAVDVVLSFKNEEGTFKNMFSSSSSSSTGVSIAALSQFKDRIKEEYSLSTEASGDIPSVFEVLSMFKNEDGGYRYGLDEAESDSFSSKDMLNAYYNLHKLLSTVGADSIGKASVFVGCATILDNMDKLNVGLESYVPDDGVILDFVRLDIFKGDTPISVLRRACQGEGLPLDASKSYVFSISYLREKSCGSGSGWVVFVNKEFLSVGAGSYSLKDGDEVQWHFTCVLNDATPIENL